MIQILAQKISIRNSEFKSVLPKNSPYHAVSTLLPHKIAKNRDQISYLHHLSNRLTKKFALEFKNIHLEHLKSICSYNTSRNFEKKESSNRNIIIINSNLQCTSTRYMIHVSFIGIFNGAWKKWFDWFIRRHRKITRQKKIRNIDAYHSFGFIDCCTHLHLSFNFIFPICFSIKKEQKRLCWYGTCSVAHAYAHRTIASARIYKTF